MTLEESLAKYNLGELNLSEFPRIAYNALAEGLESESLLILAGMNEKDNPFEIQKYLDNVIEELNLKSFKSLDAAYVLANYYVNRLRLKKMTAVETVHKIKNECLDNCTIQIVNNKYIYDGVQFDTIIGPWYEYYEINVEADWVIASGKTVIQLKNQIESELKKGLIQWQNEFLMLKIELLDQ